MKRILTRAVAGLPVALFTAVSASAQTGLIAHYTFDVDGTATVGTDAVFGASASVVTDAVVGGGSLYLSGSPPTDTLGDDGAVSGNDFDWSAGDTRTVAFWMKATAGDHGDEYSTMISLGSGAGNGDRFDIRMDGDDLRLEVQGGYAIASYAVADGTWHHVAVVATDPATVASCEYYIDGVPQGAFGGSTLDLDTKIGPLRVGDSYHPGGRDYKGHIDDVRLYDTALTDAEIAALAQAEPGVGYCFGDGSGAPCPCGNDNDGTVAGAGCANGQYTSGALLTGTGTASLSNDTLVLIGQYTENNQSGLYFQANNDLSPGNLWGDGLQCAGGGLKRLGVRFSDASGYSDTSAWATPISVKAGNITAGDTKYYQLWYRNPFNSPCGNEFNASNGYAITWAP